MLASIIVPVLNEAPAIEGVLQRLQPLREFSEVIVVDGGSSDDTPALARPYADKVITSRRGRSTQMNLGAENAQGDWLVFLHADTYLPDTFMAGSLATLNEHVGWGFFRVRLSGSHRLLRVVETFMNWRSRLSQIATGDQVIFVQSRLFYKLGGFPDIPLMEDVAFSSILKNHSAPHVMKTRVTTSSRRWEDRGIVKTVLLMWWLRFRFYCGAEPIKLAKAYYPNVKLDSK
ncbi:TIGR04283 family arsenosugar biosynthesis glycosyltransferase [Aurantivibrio plasticivorans]